MYKYYSYSTSSLVFPVLVQPTDRESLYSRSVIIFKPVRSPELPFQVGKKAFIRVARRPQTSDVVMAGDAVAVLEADLRIDPGATDVLQPVICTLKRALTDEDETARHAIGNAKALVAAVAQGLLPVARALRDGRKDDPSTLAATVKPEPVNAAGVAIKPEANPVAATYDPNEVICATAAPVSFVSPRGKFDILCLPDALVLESTTNKGVTRHVIERQHVRKLMALEPGDSNNTTNVVLAVDPKHALAIGKQSVRTVLLQARSKDKAVDVVVRHPLPAGHPEQERLDRLMSVHRDTGADPVSVVVALMEFAAGVKRAARPKVAKVFAGTGNKGCVPANVKFNAGHLFCLDDGFAFVDRPATYLPFDDIEGMQLQRAEGVSSSFDIVVTPEGGGAALEFANIPREELDGIRAYLAKRCSEAGEGQRGDEDNGSDGGVADALANAESDEDDTDDEDDEDFDGEEEEEEEEDDDDEDDDDEEGGEGEESDDEEDDGGKGTAPVQAKRGRSDDDDDEEDDSEDDAAFECVPAAKVSRF